jgi:hypothetical protein
VFLGGDGAHRHPPTTGLGLNTAIQGSHNLAWKLAAVIKGQAAAPSLLDSYELERQAIGARNVDWAMFTFLNHLVIDAGLGLMPGQPAAANRAAMEAFFAETPMGETRRARAAEIIETQRTESRPTTWRSGSPTPRARSSRTASPLRRPRCPRGRRRPGPQVQAGPVGAGDVPGGVDRQGEHEPAECDEASDEQECSGVVLGGVGGAVEQVPGDRGADDAGAVLMTARPDGRARMEGDHERRPSAPVLRHRPGRTHRAQLVARGSEAARRRRDDSVGFVIPVAGGVASFAEEGSPLNKVAGLGFGGVPGAADLDEIERAFAVCGAPVQVELAHLVDPATGALLTGRGYRLESFDNVLGFGLAGVPERVTPAGVEVRRSGDDEFDAWLDVVAEAVAHPDPTGGALAREVPSRGLPAYGHADRRPQQGLLHRHHGPNATPPFRPGGRTPPPRAAAIVLGEGGEDHLAAHRPSGPAGVTVATALCGQCRGLLVPLPPVAAEREAGGTTTGRAP